METIRFKTNLKCNGCIAAVKPSMDAIEGMIKWEVDLNTPEKEMKAEVESESNAEKIIAAFKNYGYDAERI